MTLLVILVFCKVAINLAGPETDTPKILSSLLPLANLNLSGVSSSNPPAEFTRTYLSSSYGKNVSFALACTVFVEFAVTITSNSFLMLNEDDSKSTDAMNFLGRGVYKVLSVDDWNFPPMTAKSDGLILEVGKPPSLRSDTVLIPTIVILLVSLISVTFAYVFTLVPLRRLFVNSTKSPGLTTLVNSAPVEVTVETPGAVPDFGEIVTDGYSSLRYCFTLPLKVCPTPTEL